MSGPAVLFMLMSWGAVLGLTGWAFGRILRARRHHDTDGRLDPRIDQPHRSGEET